MTRGSESERASYTVHKKTVKELKQGMQISHLKLSKINELKISVQNF